MTDRDTRHSQTDWNDRDRREREDFRSGSRQPQQWHDESHGGGQFGYDDRTRDRDFGGSQFGGGQQGGSSGSYSGASYGDRNRSWQDEDARQRRSSQSGSDYRNEQHAGGGGFSSSSGYGASSGGYGSSGYGSSGGGSSGVGSSGGYGSGYYDDRASRFGSFTSEDQGGRDFVSGNQGPYVGRSSSYGYAYGDGNRNRDYARNSGSSGYGNEQRSRGFDSDYRPQGYASAGRDYLPDDGYRADNSRSSGNNQSHHDYGSWRSYGEERGFLSRAGDEIASWFGDEDASRRREQDHRGRGPSGYTRSDERIREDANDALTHDRHVDASHITVKVEKGEVTLDGTVDSRDAKRRAEDAVEHLSGVKHVQNNLRVNDTSNRSNTASHGGTTGSSQGGSSQAASSTTGNSTTGGSTTGSSTTSGSPSGASQSGSGNSSGNNTWSAGSGSTTGASTNNTGSGAASTTATTGANKTS